MVPLNLSLFFIFLKGAALFYSCYGSSSFKVKLVKTSHKNANFDFQIL